MTSLRKRLLVWLLTGQLLAILLAGIVTFLQVRREVDQLGDAQLRQLAEALAQSGFAAVPEQGAAAAGPLQVQVWEQGELRFNNHPGRLLPRRAEPGFSSYDRGGSICAATRCGAGRAPSRSARPSTSGWGRPGRWPGQVWDRCSA